ncbi:MAG: 6-phosphofructokinase [Nitrospirae bacterium RBG_16_64_22]|nr:MAG: 6-phosphofructokinase [Nitrospirae bacterium RBG_16_64_22]
MRPIRRIGISTGGGDCPGLNAVIRAVVKTAVNTHGWEVVGIFDGFDGLIDPAKSKVLTPLAIRGILPQGGTILGTTNRGNPFKYQTEVRGKVVTRDLSPLVIRNARKMGLDAVVTIGGDGTMGIAYDLHRRGLPMVGVPKTIDNDLASTDITFGFNTAVTTATEALDKLHTTAESHHRVIVLEVMGRYAGWIALESGIAGGADVILIPEIPFDYEAMCDKIMTRRRRGSKFSLIVAAEGAKPRGGSVSLVEKGVGGRAERLGGIGQKIAAEITQRTGIDTRVTVLGHLQRGGSPTPFDRILATRLGVAAVDLVRRRRFGRLVCVRGGDISSASLASAAGKMRGVPPRGELVRVAEALRISFGR